MDTGILLGALGLVFGLVGIVATALMTRLANRDPRPVYVQSGASVARSLDRPPIAVAVSYDGHPVPAITRSEIMFWNAGRGTIYEHDVPSSHPVGFLLPSGTTVLGLRVRSVTRVETGFGCEFRDFNGRPRLIFTFNHLDQGDGGAIEVLHNGVLAPLDPIGAIARTRGRIAEIRSPLWDDPGGYKGSAILSLVFAGIAGAMGIGAIVTRSLSTGSISLMCIACAAGLAWLAWSSYRKDIRFVPERLRPSGTFNMLEISRRRPVQDQ